jgi:hypothetical protein
VPGPSLNVLAFLSMGRRRHLKFGKKTFRFIFYSSPPHDAMATAPPHIATYNQCDKIALGNVL